MPLHLLITSGPTREFFDDVRFVSNPSTGRMGAELAKAALKAGFKVTVVLGPCEAKLPRGVEVVNVVSAEEMFKVVKARFARTDVFIAAAAVSDYRPKQRLAGKLKKGADNLVIEFERTPDILAWAGARHKASQTIVGFALESDPNINLAIEKYRRKRCDLIVHNSPANFGAGGGTVRIIGARGTLWQGRPKKPELARRVIEQVSRFVL